MTNSTSGNIVVFRKPRVRRNSARNIQTLDTHRRQEEVIQFMVNEEVPATAPTFASIEVKPYTQLNVATAGCSSAIHAEYTTVEFFPEEDPSPQHMNRSSIPPNTDWPGIYSFTVKFRPQEKNTKCTAWTYSEGKEKLYVSMATACPVKVHIQSQPPPGSVIRAMAIFSRSEHITDVVRRCINHSSSADPMNDGHPAPGHLVRCDNPSSRYVEDGITGRQSVVTSYEPPPVGMDYSTYLYRFMCLGSCVGGLNRRPLQLIFTLEKDGQCLGRKVMDLRICACPGRDRRIEEKQLEKQSALKENKSNLKKNAHLIAGPLNPFKRQKSSSGEEESSYTITVYHRAHYEILKKMADALELSSLLTPEESFALRQRNARYKKKKTHHKENQQSSEESST